MIQSFNNAGTEDVFNGFVTKAARKVCPVAVHRIAVRKLDLLDSAVQIADLRVPPGNRLETLSGNRRGQYGIRINQKYRICFEWSKEGPKGVEIIDYH